MGTTGCPELSVRNYHYSLRNNPKELSSRLIRGENRKSRINDRLFIVVPVPMHLGTLHCL